MYRRLMWCYVFVLTLLDLSLNSKLTAQGKSHGVTVHESLAEGITFQEWGSESGGGAGSGRALPAGALRAEPPALAFGRAPLGAAHAATVTLTNTANTTMHLASIAGTTPDFHASFFDSKTLACGANTSFSVVFLGRREGPVAQHLYIHTSLGVLKYPVSAMGVGSEWGLWPLVGVRVPHNATLRPLLTMHNPTDHTVQVVEMYSSAAWLGLQLPGGGGSAPRAHWQLPPHSSRALARLRLRAAPAARAQPDTRAAYIRIKANVTGGPLVVVVEAAAAPAGAHADPLQLRAGTRGAGDQPYTFSISLGNSAGAGSEVSGAAWGSCRPTPHSPPPPATPPPHANGAPHTHNGAGSEGVQMSLLRTHLEPHQEPEPSAQLTLDFAKLWAGGAEDADGAEDDSSAERWCAGWAWLAGGTLPYSVRLVRGTLRLPRAMHFVTADEEGCLAAQEVVARNEFSRPVRVVSVHFPNEIQEHFHTESWAGVELAAGAERAVARLRLRARDVTATLDARLLLHTDLTHTPYSVPVRLYHGALHIEWQWPNATSSSLALGTLGTSSTRRVRARVHNPAPAPLCATAHSALPPATLELHAPDGCVPAGGWSPAVLTVVAPARAGAVRAAVWLSAPAANTTTTVTLRALPGAVRARLVHAPAPADRDHDHHAAPWASGWSPELVVESSMAVRMKLTNVEPQPHPHPPDPALVFIPPSEPEAAWISPGTQTVGRLQYLPERACGAACYTGHAPDWLRAPLHDQLALLARRRALYRADHAGELRNVSLLIDTTEMLRIPVSGWVRMGWPRLVRGAGWVGLAGVVGEEGDEGEGGARLLRVRNPSHHPLLLHAHVAGPHPDMPDTLVSLPECAHKSCVSAAHVFRAGEWRAVRGAVTSRREPHPDTRLVLLLAPRAEIDLHIQLRPTAPLNYSAVLYLRNNLTIVEAIEIGGQGAVPSFELAGRRAHAHAPITLQVSECSEGQECGEGEGEGRWEARRTVVARNTGAVPLRLRGWRLAGEPCQARGFAIEPCAPLTLAPNESRALTLAFRADCSLARVSCLLTLRAGSGAAAFRLTGGVPARLLPACAAALPRVPREPALRAAAALGAVLALAAVLAAAALDAERLLRRARDARAAPAPRAPLDLRALAREAPPAPPPPAAPRRRRPARRARPPTDPVAERRAFERWRAEVLRRDAPRVEDSSSRSSEEPEPPPDATAAHEPSDTEPDTEGGGARSGDSSSPGSGSSSPAEEEPPRAPPAPPGPQPPPPPRAPPSPPSPPTPEPRPAAAPPTIAAPRARRSPGSPARRTDPPARPRPTLGKHHARKDKISKRRGERTGGATAAPSAVGAGGAGAGAAGPLPALRWGASWSSVVAAGAPAAPATPPSPPTPAPPPHPAAAPAPRAPAPAPADHSLFYFNDAHLQQPPPEPEYAWRSMPDRSPFDAAPPLPPAPAPGDYRVPGAEEAASNHSNAYGTIGSPWSGGALWGALRPPPGFGPRAPLAPHVPHAPHAPHVTHVTHAAHTAHAAPAPPVRAFDPFHSLASIWAPAAFDWRADRDARDPRDH